MSGLAGAVLCSREILELCQGEHASSPLISDLDKDQLKGAKYDLRMAETGMVLPSGDMVRADSATPHSSMILLQPGQTIFVSTRERLRMPLNLVGNMSIKGELSRQGILPLTGMIVDPGYDEGPSEDGRLHFRLANLGKRAVALTPGKTAVASIQFLPLAENVKGPSKVPNVWDDPQELTDGLGFIEELREQKRELTELQHEFANQRRSTEYVIAAAVGLILATILGVVITALLSLGADSELVDSAKNVIPDDGRGQLLFVLGLFGLGAISWSIIVGWSQGRRPLAPVPVAHRRTEEEAVRDLGVDRARRLCIGIALAGLAIWGAVAVSMALKAPTEIDVLAGVVVGMIGIWAILKFAWEPITQSEVDERMKRWMKTASP